MNSKLNSVPLFITSDHAGFELKEYLKEILLNSGFELEDLGPNDEVSVDYPDYGAKLGQAITGQSGSRGILICGTGIGMSMVINKFPGVRGALCHNIYTARMSRAHNDANVLVLGGRVIGKGLAEEMVTAWLNTEFEGGRHQRRVDKIEGHQP